MEERRLHGPGISRLPVPPHRRERPRRRDSMARISSIWSGPSFQGPLYISSRVSWLPCTHPRGEPRPPVTETGLEWDGLRARSLHVAAQPGEPWNPRQALCHKAHWCGDRSGAPGSASTDGSSPAWSRVRMGSGDGLPPLQGRNRVSVPLRRPPRPKPPDLLSPPPPHA
jgi:hypothetical protein